MLVREGRREDIPLFERFIRGLADYERLAGQVVLDATSLDRYLFGSRAYAETLVAEDSESGEALGFALWFHNFSTFLGRPGIYLEDLFVEPRWRGRGAGRALLKRLAEIAVERECGRLQWSVLDWNESAIGFYRSLGAVPQDEWTAFSLEGSALTDLAGGR